MSNLHGHKLPHATLPGGGHHDSQVLVAVAMIAIAAAFVLSVAVAVSSITRGLKTVTSNMPPAATSAPVTTGSGNHS
jgi:hypothetical protein